MMNDEAGTSSNFCYHVVTQFGYHMVGVPCVQHGVMVPVVPVVPWGFEYATEGLTPRDTENSPRFDIHIYIYIYIYNYIYIYLTI